MIHRGPTTALLCCAALLTSACSKPVAEIGVSRALAERRAAVISTVSYRLRFDIPAAAAARIPGHVTIGFDLADASQPLQLDFRQDASHVARIEVNNREADWQLTNEHIVIQPGTLRDGANTVEIDFLAGSDSLHRNPDYLYTLFVPDRARTAFPVFDQPDLKAHYELTLTVPAGWAALSNGAIVSADTTSDATTYRFARTGPISSYLFSFVAGRFEAVTRERNGRPMTMLHRETDTAKVERNVEAIFDLHAAAVAWLEDYTGIAYPWEKLDFALIPDFQYGGMEHVGAVLYRASRLLLDEAPTQPELLRRASVIAHETAHMWFGDLVTMRWFDDVWMKEVFANFMAAKIVNPSFPEVNHDLRFLADHSPSAYSVDRTGGANAIRQPLGNLIEAGQLYGPIIYDKAPVVMRQLELILGAAEFRAGLREYLQRFAFGNASWPDLIDLLDRRTAVDLASWSEVWVETAGRPEFAPRYAEGANGATIDALVQRDPAGLGRIWPQRFSIGGSVAADVAVREPVVQLPAGLMPQRRPLVFNADGMGYGLFPADLDNLGRSNQLSDVAKASELINVYENALAGRIDNLEAYFLVLLDVIAGEKNELILDLALDQCERLYRSFLSERERADQHARLETVLWQTLLRRNDSASRRLLFLAFAALAESSAALDSIHGVWSGAQPLEGLSLSEDEQIEVAATLAIRWPAQAEEIVATQLGRTRNPDNRRRLEFIAPSLSPSQETRDDFFHSLSLAVNREMETWVVEALENLHHPSRTAVSEQYIPASLELLEEIQASGDIFFPSDWLRATLQNQTSARAAGMVRSFLAERPDYNPQLRMKVLQAADLLFRSQALVGSTTLASDDDRN